MYYITACCFAQLAKLFRLLLHFCMTFQKIQTKVTSLMSQKYK